MFVPYFGAKEGGPTRRTQEIRRWLLTLSMRVDRFDSAIYKAVALKKEAISR